MSELSGQGYSNYILPAEVTPVRKKNKEKFGSKERNLYFCRRKGINYIRDMKQVEYITVKKASRQVLKHMRQIGQEKAQRLHDVQERWNAGEYDNIQIVQL